MTRRNIPARARRVFRGKFFSIYQWRQKLFDGSTAVFERATRPDATIVIPITPDKRIILLRQKQPRTSWFTSFPGGMVEPGESAQRSASRELHEETGYRAAKITRWFTAPSPSFRVSSSVHVFIAHGCVRKGVPHRDAGEHIAMRLITLKDLFRIALRRDFRHPNITLKLLRAQLDSREMRALRKKLFG